MSGTLRHVALVTGAGSGGAAVAARLIDSGYTVYGTSRKVEASRSTLSGVVMRAMDVRDDATVVALVDEVVHDAGQTDVLVNNAGSALVGAREETALGEAKGL
jgi:NADP-dependent 3-hydroxy acid dehydrogenase YdfG